MKIFFYYYNFVLGKMGIIEKNKKISNVFFIDQKTKFQGEKKETLLIQETAKQLKEYFAGNRKKFILPLIFEGTNFQKMVWNTLCTIPYGEVRTYKEIAALIGKKQSSRAVGQAINHNPIIIINPCHRVIGTDGSLMGFRAGIQIKQKLLSIEKVFEKE